MDAFLTLKLTREQAKQLWTAMTQYTDNSDPERTCLEVEEAEEMGWKAKEAYEVLETLDAAFGA